MRSGVVNSRLEFMLEACGYCEGSESERQGEPTASHPPSTFLYSSQRSDLPCGSNGLADECRNEHSYSLRQLPGVQRWTCVEPLAGGGAGTVYSGY